MRQVEPRSQPHNPGRSWPLGSPACLIPSMRGQRSALCLFSVGSTRKMHVASKSWRQPAQQVWTSCWNGLMDFEIIPVLGRCQRGAVDGSCAPAHPRKSGGGRPARSSGSRYALGKHFESFVRKELASGRYSSVSDVIVDGLKLLEKRRMRH